MINSPQKSPTEALLDVTGMTFVDAGSLEFHILTGADVNARNEEGNTALFLVCCSTSVSGVEKLLKHKADPNLACAETGMTPLIAASISAPAASVRLLLAAGAQIDAHDNLGDTALMKAAFFGRTKIISLLLEAKADVTLINKSGKNALMLAKQRTDKPGNVFMLREAVLSAVPPIGTVLKTPRFKPRG